MDMMSMVTSLLAAKSGGVQMQVAATIMKSNADAENCQCRRWRRRQSRYFGLKSMV